MGQKRDVGKTNTSMTTQKMKTRGKLPVLTERFQKKTSCTLGIRLVCWLCLDYKDKQKRFVGISSADGIGRFKRKEARVLQGQTYEIDNLVLAPFLSDNGRWQIRC